jgi:hypothetical protein
MPAGPVINRISALSCIHTSPVSEADIAEEDMKVKHAGWPFS